MARGLAVDTVPHVAPGVASPALTHPRLPPGPASLAPVPELGVSDVLPTLGLRPDSLFCAQESSPQAVHLLAPAFALTSPSEEAWTTPLHLGALPVECPVPPASPCVFFL